MMSAAILAGGRGTRVATYGEPKCLIEVGGKPFIDWLLTDLDYHGFDDIVMCLGYRAGDIVDHVKQKYDWVRFSTETHELGTGGAIKAALHLLRRPYFFVLNGDTIFKFEYPRTRGWSQGMIVHESRYGNAFDDEGKIVLYNKTARDGNAIDCGGWWHQGDFHIRKSSFDLDIVIQNRIKHAGLWGFPTHGPVHHIGTPEGINEARRYHALHKRLP